MDFSGVSMALSQASMPGDIGVLMLSKALDTNEAIGEGMVKMLDAAAMEQSVTPHIGGNIDLYV